MREKKTPSLGSVAIVILSVLLPLLAFLCIFPCLCGRKHMRASRIPSFNGSSTAPPPPPDNNSVVTRRDVDDNTSTITTTTTNTAAGGVKKTEQGKLAFVREEGERFELHDLLRSSAEVLGSGVIGVSYKAAVPCKAAMVVKRYKVMNGVGRGEFQEHMNRLGRLSHPNLLPLVAYYYRKEEKLLVFDFIHNGSLANHLHGNGNKRMEWRRRVRIIKGVGRGLVHLHTELRSMALPHGHLKSSNVLLDESFTPKLADYGLLPLMEVGDAELVMEAFKAPEFERRRSVSRKSEVWCLGRLILELVTGRVGVVVERGEDVVLDKSMGVAAAAAAGFLNQASKLATIGMLCSQPDVDTRPDLREVVHMLEQIREEDVHN